MSQHRSGSRLLSGALALALTGGSLATLTALAPVAAHAAAPSLELTTSATTVAGQPLSITVTAYDALGDVDTTDNDALVLSSSDPVAYRPGVALTDGTATFDVVLYTAGLQSVTASDAGQPALGSPSQSVTVTADVPQHVTVHSGDQQSARAGHDFTAPLSVLLTDAYGNPTAAQQVVFTVPAGSDATIGGTSVNAVFSNSSGIATSGTVNAGSTPGALTIGATDTGLVVLQPGCDCELPRTPAANGSTSFTETVEASDASLVTVPLTSSGTGTATQSVTIPIPPGGSVTLLDGNGQPVTQLVTPQGTYTLDPATGLLTFVAAKGFSGTPTPATYRVTDGFHQTATSTYTPFVTPAPPTVPPPVGPGVSVGAHVRAAAHVVMAGRSFSAVCSVPALGTCRTRITAHVGKRQLVLGTSTTTKAKAGAASVKTIVRLTARGRALAARPGGVKVTLWATLVTTKGQSLSTKLAISLVHKHVRVPTVLFATGAPTLTASAKHRLKVVKAHLGAVKVITCVGFADSDSTASAKARARAVCRALARRGVRVVVTTRRDKHPSGIGTAAGRAHDARVEVTLTY